MRIVGIKIDVYKGLFFAVELGVTRDIPDIRVRRRQELIKIVHGPGDVTNVPFLVKCGKVSRPMEKFSINCSRRVDRNLLTVRLTQICYQS